MKEEEKQYFYIYFAVAIIFPQVSQSKTAKAPNLRSLSTMLFPQITSNFITCFFKLIYTELQLRSEVVHVKA